MNLVDMFTHIMNIVVELWEWKCRSGIVRYSGKNPLVHFQSQKDFNSFFQFSKFSREPTHLARPSLLFLRVGDVSMKSIILDA